MLGKGQTKSFCLPEFHIGISLVTDCSVSPKNVEMLPTQLSSTTSTLSQRKGRAPQPSITWGGGSQPGGVSQPASKGGWGPP